ncbi:NAD(P)-dependent dehydrogenase (short-subunit alcohol dehydrogenase family) [Paraburkholderia sp. WSM4175]|uniref:SDR family oxidoreductase n=1 Tax=Paraburkholderia sp. WSM4175 TaxID=2991072 RepID=UPI003D209DC5
MKAIVLLVFCRHSSKKKSVRRLLAFEVQVPVGRIGEASDIATAALFLATDVSRYMLDAESVVDGGISLL